MIKEHLKYLIATKNYEELAKFGNIDDFLSPDDSQLMHQAAKEQEQYRQEEDKIILQEDINTIQEEAKIPYRELPWMQITKLASTLQIKISLFVIDYLVPPFPLLCLPDLSF